MKDITILVLAVLLLVSIGFTDKMFRRVQFLGEHLEEVRGTRNGYWELYRNCYHSQLKRK